MLKTFLVTSLFFCSSQLLAQRFYPFFKKIEGERKVVSDTALVKIAPSTGAAVEDTLYLGSIVEIEMMVPYTENRNGIVSPWLKVLYKKGLYKKIGFVSAIDVSLHSKAISNNYEILCGINKNDKADSVVKGEVFTKNNYECKLVVLEKNKEITRVNFAIEDKEANDSFSIKLNEKVKLSKASMHIEFQQFNLKDTTKEFYTSNLVLCKSKSLALLPTTHDYIKTNDFPFPTSKLILKKCLITVVTEFNKLMPQTIKDEYEWKDCAIKFKESK